MWANQISADGGLQVDGGLGEAGSGYQIDDANQGLFDTSITQDIDAAPTQDTAEPLVDASGVPMAETAPAQDTVLEGTRPQTAPSPEGPAAAAVAGTQVDETPVTFSSSDIGEAPTIETVPPQDDNPVTSTDSAPVAFPSRSSDEAPSQKAPSAQGITFAPEVGTPERRGSPDPDAEPKRKRISSQNFQRLARRISITTRRAGSVSNIPILGSLRRDTSSASASAQAQSSTDGDAVPTVTSESPDASIQGEPDKDKVKKKEKEKKRRTFL